MTTKIKPNRQLLVQEPTLNFIKPR